jgi:hypothetical protein
MTRPMSAGDVIPSDSRVIEVRVSELRQLLNAIDPSPFRDRDLDPRAEEFIVGWARDLPRDASLALRVHLDRAAGRPDEATLLAGAVHQYFHARAAASRRQLRDLFGRGRISLLIGLAFLAGSLTLSDIIGNVSGGGFVALLREGFIIGGWVAMWRPLEVFLGGPFAAKFVCSTAWARCRFGSTTARLHRTMRGGLTGRRCHPAPVPTQKRAPSRSRILETCDVGGHLRTSAV